MYLAVEQSRETPLFSIRESYREDGTWKSRTLLKLDRRPESYLVYIGDASFYVDDVVEDALRSRGVRYDRNELESLFLPYVKPEIRERLYWFDRRGSSGNRGSKPTYQQMSEEQKGVHPFDKRRLHYLRLGRVDQGSVETNPYRFFGRLLNKSRDELEHFFLDMEAELRPREYPQYVYTILNLQEHVSRRMTRFVPGAQQQEEVDALVMEHMTNLSRDGEYLGQYDTDYACRAYLQRYLVMYFDYEGLHLNPLDEYLRIFMERRRKYAPPPAPATSETAREWMSVMGLDEERYRSMDLRQLTRWYRRKAHELHPDKGGEHEAFVDLTRAYECLVVLKKKSG